MLTSVAVPLLDAVAPFELGVLCEVFGVDRSAQGVPRLDFWVCSATPHRPLTTISGFTVTAPHPFAVMDQADLIAVPASACRSGYSPHLLAALRRACARGAWVLSVCSGAFVLAAAGLLDGRRCTTHWMYADELARLVPSAQVDPDVLFVVDGNVITSAGTAAGIDACLHLVRIELGSATASAIARRMVVPPQRDGGQRQYIEAPIPHVPARTLQPVLAWAVEHLAEDLSVERLAAEAVLSPRSFARRFNEETGTTPLKWVVAQRVLLARRLLEETELSVDEVAVRSGFGTAAGLRHHFAPVVGSSPSSYRRTFSQTRACG